MSDVSTYALYCDDIRQEISGKQSYMGVYNAELVVPAFPTNLQKLCVQVTVRAAPEIFKDVKVKLTYGEHELANVEFPPAEAQKAIDQAVQLDPQNPIGVVLFSLQFLPLQLDRPEIIRPIVYVGGVEYQCNTLNARLPKETEMGMFPQQ